MLPDQFLTDDKGLRKRIYIPERKGKGGFAGVTEGKVQSALQIACIQSKTVAEVQF